MTRARLLIEISVSRSDDDSNTVSIDGPGDFLHLLDAFRLAASMMGLSLDEV